MVRHLSSFYFPLLSTWDMSCNSLGTMEKDILSERAALINRIWPKSGYLSNQPTSTVLCCVEYKVFVLILLKTLNVARLLNNRFFKSWSVLISTIQVENKLYCYT